MPGPDIREVVDKAGRDWLTERRVSPLLEHEVRRARAASLGGDVVRATIVVRRAATGWLARFVALAARRLRPSFAVRARGR